MKFASAPIARAALLALAAALALASNAPPDPPAQYPYGQQPYAQQPGQPYGQPQPGYDPYGQPQPGQPQPGQPQPGPGGGDDGLGALRGGGDDGQPAAPGVPGQDYCFTLRTTQTTTSICAVGFGGCERQRQAAVADGQTTTECVPWSPVACFQLGGDPSPGSRFCAANLEDCELWRTVDRQNHGSTGDACAWK